MVKDKSRIRKKILQVRRSMDEAEKGRLDMKICRQILSLPVYRTAQTVMAYLNTWDEVQTAEIVRDILDSGKRLIVPYCDLERSEIIPCEIFDLTGDLQTGNFGIREPNPANLKPIAPGEIDLVLVPGIAFDHGGNRIGFGKGFYDRFLPKLKSGVCVAGLAYSCQVVEHIAAEKHDYKMSLLITENSIIYLA
jgi:5-formyltetrahydrofolate cyclo-ligase